MITIRTVKNADIIILSEYWYDNIALIQQSNARIRLLPDARRRWEQSAMSMMQATATCFLVAEFDAELLGCIIGHSIPNQAGLAPELIGSIDDLILDLHTPHKQHGTGRALLEAMKQHFIECNITQLQVAVSIQSTVAQAFWLGVGAKKTDEIYWMNL